MAKLNMVDTRTKAELKADGDYTPAYWRKLKTERGWLTTPHGQARPPKRRASNVPSYQYGRAA